MSSGELIERERKREWLEKTIDGITNKIETQEKKVDELKAKVRAARDAYEQHLLNDATEDLQDTRTKLEKLEKEKDTYTGILKKAQDAATGTRQPKKLIGLQEVLNAEGVVDRLMKPYPLLKTEGKDWVYQNGESLRERLCKTFRTNRKLYLTNERDKSTVTQTMLCAGLGMGKTRALTMVPELLKSETEGKKLFVFNVSFENRSGFNPAYENASTRAVVDRIVCHLTEAPFDLWRQQNTANFSLDDLIRGLYKKMYGKEPGTPICEDVVCLLAIDGVHNLAHNSLRPADDDPMRVFLQSELKFFQLTSDFFCFVVCSLTARKSAEASLEGTSTSRIFIPVPRVTVKPDNVNFSEKLFSMVKGHGRAVEALSWMRKKQPSATDVQLLEGMSKVLAAKYGEIIVSEEVQKTLLKKALLDEPVRETDENLVEHLRRGLMVVENGSLQLSLVWAIANAITRGSLLSQYNWSLNSESFESFLLWFRATLSKLHKCGTTTDLAAFHKGVKWMKAPKVHFTNVHLQTRYAVNRISTCGTETPTEIKSKPSPGSDEQEEVKVPGYIFKNAKGASSGDIFLELNKGVNEVLQAKHLVSQPVPKKEDTLIPYLKEVVLKSADKTDVFLLHTTGTFPDDWATWCKEDSDLKDRIIGIVDATNFEEYYHCFAPLWLHEKKTNRPRQPVSAFAPTPKKQRMHSKPSHMLLSMRCARRTFRL